MGESVTERANPCFNYLQLKCRIYRLFSSNLGEVIAAYENIKKYSNNLSLWSPLLLTSYLVPYLLKKKKESLNIWLILQREPSHILAKESSFVSSNWWQQQRNKILKSCINWWVENKCVLIYKNKRNRKQEVERGWKDVMSQSRLAQQCYQHC